MEQEFPDTCWRRRRVFLNERDELAFSRVLREFCAHTVMYDHDGVLLPTIAHARNSYAVDICMPSPGQEKTWAAPTDHRQASRQSICYFRYVRCKWHWDQPGPTFRVDPPHLREGEFIVLFPCKDPVMQRFAMRVFNLVRKVTWNSKNLISDREQPLPRPVHFGLAVSRWSQTGGPVRRSVDGSMPLDPSHDIRLNKYYDDSLWNDRLPDEPTMRGHEYLEWHRLPVRRRALDPNDR